MHLKMFNEKNAFSQEAVEKTKRKIRSKTKLFGKGLFRTNIVLSTGTEIAERNLSTLLKAAAILETKEYNVECFTVDPLEYSFQREGIFTLFLNDVVNGLKSRLRVKEAEKATLYSWNSSYKVRTLNFGGVMVSLVPYDCNEIIVYGVLEEKKKEKEVYEAIEDSILEALYIFGERVKEAILQERGFCKEVWLFKKMEESFSLTVTYGKNMSVEIENSLFDTEIEDSFKRNLMESIGGSLTDYKNIKSITDLRSFMRGIKISIRVQKEIEKTLFKDDNVFRKNEGELEVNEKILPNGVLVKGYITYKDFFELIQKMSEKERNIGIRYLSKIFKEVK